MAGRKKNRFIELCFMCQSKRVRYGYCHDCGHLSKYAHMRSYYEPKRQPKEPPAQSLIGGGLWVQPVRDPEDEIGD